MARHGGVRYGTPGRQYGNRTDLNASRAPDSGLATPASGGVTPPAPSAAGPPTGPSAPVHPDTVTPLDAPTSRPSEPVTAGLPTGPGLGPSSGANQADLLAMRRYLPFLLAAANKPETPASVVAFVQFLQTQVGQS